MKFRDLVLSFREDEAMDRRRRLLERLRRGQVQNVGFDEFCDLLVAFGFTLDRITGSHHHYYHPGLPRPLTIQSRRGQAKGPQIKQLLREVRRYNLILEVENEPLPHQPVLER